MKVKRWVIERKKNKKRTKCEIGREIEICHCQKSRLFEDSDKSTVVDCRQRSRCGVGAAIGIHFLTYICVRLVVRRWNILERKGNYERKIQLVFDFIQQWHETLLAVTRENLVQCYYWVKCKTSFSAHKVWTKFFSNILKYLLLEDCHR